MSIPAVSVVIPARNAADFIAEQLESLAEQTDAPEFEIVVADNGSSDATAETAQEVAAALGLDLRVVDAGGVPSASHGRNVGAQAARGQILAFCDADDLVNESWVSDLAAGVDSRKDVIVAGALHHERFNSPEVLAAYRVGPDPTPEQFTALPRLTSVDRGFAGYLATVPGGNFAIRRDDYVRLGGMDPSYPGGAEETDFAWRAQEAGLTVMVAPRAVVHYRLKGQARRLFRQQRIQQRGRIYLWTRYRDKGMVGPSLKASAKVLLGAPLRAVAALRDPARRLAWAYETGAHTGALEGMARYRMKRITSQGAAAPQARELDRVLQDPAVERAVVISLVDSERREIFRRQPGATRFTFWDAVNGRTEDCSPWFDIKASVDRTGITPTPGFLGCASSHLQVVQEFARTEGPDNAVMVVAEDDVLFRPETATLLSWVIGLRRSFDVAVLSDHWAKEERAHFRRLLTATSQLSALSVRRRVAGKMYTFGRFSGPAWSAGLYVVTRRGARRYTAGIESNGGRQDTAADDWKRFRDRWGLDVHVLRPGVVDFMGGSMTRPEEALESEERAVASAAPTSRLDRLRTALALRSRLAAARLLVEATRRDLAFRRRNRS